MNRRRLTFLATLLLSLLVGYADYLTGSQISMMLLYALPILISARFCGKAEGVTVALVAASCWALTNIAHQRDESSGLLLSWNALTRLGIFLLLAYAVSLQNALKRALEREKERADRDRLTGLFNKEAFRVRVSDEMHRAQRYSHPISLAFIDLDNFKQVNDTQGHARGDRLLQQVSEIMTTTVRKTDIVGRVGGDEFCICFPETDGGQVQAAIQKLVGALDIMTSQSGWQVTASIGVVSCNKFYETYDVLLGLADKLMYSAKSKGKNSAEFSVIGEQSAS